jgi:hypothetical protein
MTKLVTWYKNWFNHTFDEGNYLSRLWFLVVSMHFGLIGIALFFYISVILITTLGAWIIPTVIILVLALIFAIGD